jgi:hypothetical protein
MSNLAKESEQFRAIVEPVATPAEARRLAFQFTATLRGLLRTQAATERAYRAGRATFDHMAAGLLPALSEPDQARLRALIERIVAETRPNLERNVD